MLPKLISYIRSAHSHEPGLCFSCGIDCCPRTFKNTNTYKHVRSVHKNRYSVSSDTLLVKKSLLKENFTSEDEDNASNDSEGDSDVDFLVGGDATHPESQVQVQENSSEILGCNDIVKVACGHLIRLKCKAGVTQTLLPSIVEMNEAVVDGVLTNISSKVMERFQANGIEAESPLAREVRDVIESHRNPLQSLQTVYCQNSHIQAHYPMIVSPK